MVEDEIGMVVVVVVVVDGVVVGIVGVGILFTDDDEKLGVELSCWLVATCWMVVALVVRVVKMVVVLLVVGVVGVGVVDALVVVVLIVDTFVGNADDVGELDVVVLAVVDVVIIVLLVCDRLAEDGMRAVGVDNVVSATTTSEQVPQQSELLLGS